MSMRFWPPDLSALPYKRALPCVLPALAVMLLALTSCKEGHFGEPPPTPERAPQSHPGQ